MNLLPVFHLFFFFSSLEARHSDLFYAPAPVPCSDIMPLSLPEVLPTTKAEAVWDHDTNMTNMPLILNHTLRSRCSPPHSDRDFGENEKQCALNGATYLLHLTLESLRS